MELRVRNPKSQIPNKLQIPNDQVYSVSNLGDWDLFGIWCFQNAMRLALCALRFILS
jgi:hypothetical protein